MSYHQQQNYATIGQPSGGQKPTAAAGQTRLSLAVESPPNHHHHQQHQHHHRANNISAPQTILGQHQIHAAQMNPTTNQSLNPQPQSHNPNHDTIKQTELATYSHQQLTPSQIYGQIYQPIATCGPQFQSYRQQSLPTVAQSQFHDDNFPATTPVLYNYHYQLNQPVPLQPQASHQSTFCQLHDADRRLPDYPNISYNIQNLVSGPTPQAQTLPQQQGHRFLLANLGSPTNIDKTSTLPSHFQQGKIPSAILTTGDSMIDVCRHPTNDDKRDVNRESSVNNSNHDSQSDNVDRKAVPTSSSTTTASSFVNKKEPPPSGTFKSYLTHLVLESNVPFAYAIILVALLITIIAATSIITILTIALTITGYQPFAVTENTFNASLAIGVICASFALALVTVSLIVWRRHCQAAYYYLDDPQSASRGTNSPQLSETYDDSEYGSVPVSDWAKHVQKLHSDGDIGFSKEFEQIQKIDSSNLSCVHSQLAENKLKNRYINIVAYDHTRVTLRPIPGQKKPGSDYINANFIDGYNKPRAYIGTQGPLVSTFDDYWRMIWEQRVVIIVMITNLQERGRRKCDMYWPKDNSETYGHIQVKLLQEVVMATYTLRTFTVRNLKLKKRQNGSERTVYQYHYTNWPDHGVPDHPLPVLSFVRKSTSANPPGAGAIICHCSAGCGRSGTYIVIDAMLKQIRHRQSINVVDFLKHIRSQRNYLVQTEEQYIFIHDALVEAIESGETEIASNFVAKYIQLLQNGDACQPISQKNSSYSLSNAQSLSVVNDNDKLLVATANGVAGAKLAAQSTGSRTQSAAGQWSLLERQYRLVASFKAKDFNVVSALKPCNKAKNRTLNLIPLEAHRVHITPKPGADGSDYINATFLMGFNHLREFIVTQHPVHETFSDFWQMVYDHNSQTIVLLTPIEATSPLEANQKLEFPQFWPQKEDEVDYGSFKVKLIQESSLVKPENGDLIITRDFIMRSNQDDYELQTRVIHCPGWPECCGPLSGVFELIQVVQQATQQQASRQRMHDGLGESATITIGQEHEPQNGGPIIVVDKFGGTEAATFAVLTTLFKQINFEDAVDVYMYAKLAHLRRPGIWSSQDDYLFLYRAIENYASSLLESQQQQQQQQQQLANIQSNQNLSFHHQTMTLDRHKQKPNLATGGTLKASTMRRAKDHNNNNNTASSNMFQRQQQSPADLAKGQLIIEHSQNNQLGASSNNNLVLMQQQQQQQRINQQLKALQNTSSPYNSAINIGTSPHQHLLASSNGRPQHQLSHVQQSAQQQQQQSVIDHYMYH